MIDLEPPFRRARPEDTPALPVLRLPWDRQAAHGQGGMGKPGRGLASPRPAAL